MKENNMKHKYLILDFGKIIVYPTTGDWDITPKFLELIDISKLDIDKFNEVRKNYNYLLSEKLITQEEEYDMFIRFYDGILSELSIPGYTKEIGKQIAYDRAYNHTKYTLYDCIYSELDKLKEKYTLILLTDNWPCVTSYLKDNNLYDYFDKIYISSVYQELKKDGVFFNHPIEDYNIKPHEAIFIDDTEVNLDEASKKNLDVYLMDREKEVANSKYTIIHDLNNI